MAILSKAGITSGSLIQASQITQIIDAFTASGSVIDISITGSLSVEGTTNLGKLGKNTQSPLIFNPDAQGNSVFYAKNPSGTFTIGTGANPYAGSDLVTLSPLGTLGVAGNLNVGFTASAVSILVTGKTGLGTTTPQARLSVSNNGTQSIEMDYSAVLNANYIESYNRSSSAPMDLVYYMSPGTGSHRFYTNGAERIRVDKDGYVGINTNTPISPLNVNGSTIITGSTTLFNNGGTLDLRGTNHSYIQWYPDNSTRRAYFGFAASGSTNIILENENASGTIALVTNNGFVGINKYTPTSPLDVNGNVIVTGSITATNNITSAGTISSPTMTTTTFSSTNTTNVNTTTTNFSASGIVTVGTPGVTNASHIQFWPNDASGNAYYIEDYASIFSIGSGVYGSGTSVLSINGGNNVGIGKTTPTTKLDVNGNTIITGSLTTTSNAVISGSLTTKSNAVISGSTIIRSTDNEILTAIGGNSSVSAIVAQGGQPSFTLKDQSGVEKWTIFKPVATNNLSFWNGSAVVLSLQSGGNIGIGANNTTPLTKLDVRSSDANDVLFASNTNASFANSVIVLNTTRAAITSSFFIYGTANTVNTYQVSTNGSTRNQTGVYGAISDIKLKENIVNTTPKLEKLKQVRVVNYNFKESLGYNSTEQIGVIAQELEQIFPGLIEETPDRDTKGKILKTTTKSVKYSVFVPILIKAVQEQQTQIEELKLQVATLLSGSIN
jgi:hypothetical protein